MTEKSANKKYVVKLSRDTLDTFKNVASRAETELREHRTMGASSLASVNTMTDDATVRNLENISLENERNLRTLSEEPAIARVVVSDENDKKQTYYICRAVPITGAGKLAGYSSKFGRVASLPVGSEFTLPNGKVVDVVERAILRPLHQSNGWDSRDSVLEDEKFGVFTVSSLREILDGVLPSGATGSVLDDLLAEEKEQEAITQGRKRDTIKRMGLRDQPILDQVQDEIFRLSLDTRLMILGPPGTGKTTTLVKRIAQKTATTYLDENELQALRRISTDSDEHSKSWLMFTPTKLLKQYLRDAFNRESIPASNETLKTWTEFRWELARLSFPILKTATGGGPFVMKDGTVGLLPATYERQHQWFEQFDGWQRKEFFSRLQKAGERLSDSDSDEAKSLAEALSKTLQHTEETDIASALVSLMTKTEAVQEFLDARKKETDEKIERQLVAVLNSDREFLDKFAKFIDEIKLSEIEDADEDEDGTVELDEETELIGTGRLGARNAYLQAIRAQARSFVLKRTIKPGSRSGKLLTWLGDRALPDEKCADIGRSLVIQSYARQFANPLRGYLSNLPGRFRQFRRALQKEGSDWYSGNKFEQRHVDPLEVDLILLSILKAARSLLSRRSVLSQIDEPRWSPLATVNNLFRNQVYVDEATDFSPVQMACMRAISNPSLDSFFACGDFNQRLTDWGTRSVEDLKWVASDFELREVSIVYRQTRKLNEFAREIISASGGVMPNVEMPEFADNEGLAPALFEGATNPKGDARWISARILDIERHVEELPSTAVFVNTEAEVRPVAESLQAELADHNIQVVACPDGEVMGNDHDVRVFDIQHIKGLEFEAVFYIDLDKLADIHPGTFDKYLYVGATRAATYLGITCSSKLPDGLGNMRSLFVSAW